MLFFILKKHLSCLNLHKTIFLIMNKNKLIIGIISLSLIASAFSFWVYRKKKNDESWRLIKLPDGVFKRNKNIKISRTN